jgi:hypothetical protein
MAGIDGDAITPELEQRLDYEFGNDWRDFADDELREMLREWRVELLELVSTLERVAPGLGDEHPPARRRTIVRRPRH